MFARCSDTFGRGARRLPLAPWAETASGYALPIRRVWTAGLIVCGLVLAGPAAASDPLHPDPLPYTAMSPADGATFGPRTNGNVISFSFSSPQQWLEASVEVSSSPILGRDGTLADEYQRDFGLLFQSDASPGTYQGQTILRESPGSWTATIGTYYWQVHAFGYDFSAPGPPFHNFVGPVRTIHIGATGPNPTGPPSYPDIDPESGPDLYPPSPRPTISHSQARSRLLRIIQRKRRPIVRRLRRACSRLSYRTFRCKARWIERRYSYHVVGRITHLGKQAGTYLLEGNRISRACVRRHGVRQCDREAVFWYGRFRRAS